MRKRTFLLLLSFLSLSTFTYAVDAWIRINQLGYLPNARKKAILISESPQHIKKFSIHDALTNQLLATLEAVTDKGEFPPFKNTYLLDFSNFREEGAFYIKAGLIYSPTIFINKNTYLGTADFLLNYIRHQRNEPTSDILCLESTGEEPVFTPIEKTTNVIVQKATPAKNKTQKKPDITQIEETPKSKYLPVSGGWSDTPGNLQHGSIAANTAYQLLFAYQMNPGSFDDQCNADGTPGQNRIPDILDEAKWGLDWLLKMFPAPETLYHQIAGEPTGSDKIAEKNVYIATGKPQGTNVSKNHSNGIASVAGKYASALGLGAEILASFYPDYADTLKQKAIEAFDLGKKYPGVCQSVPLKNSILYPEDNWTDDMELAAAQLYRLTYEGRFLKEAAGFGRMEPVTPWMCSDTARHYQWYPFVNLGHYMMANVENPRYQKEYTQNLLNGLQRMNAYAATNPFSIGVPFIRSSNNLIVALATQCRLYRSLTNDSTYLDMENALVDWLFGRNPWGVGMITKLPETGYTPTAPAGLPKDRVVPGGALVTGPVQKKVFSSKPSIFLANADANQRFQSDWAVFHDNQADDLTNSPTFDGTAALTYLLAARQQEGVAGKTADWNEYSYGGITRTDITKRQISLVFCGNEFADGYKTIRKTLRKLNIKASFFFTGDFYNKRKFRKIIRGLKEDHHYLGAQSDKNLLYCSWKNRDSLLVTKNQFLNDLRANYAKMEKFGISKNQAPFFLPANQWYNDSISRWCKEVGLHVISCTPGTLSYTDNSTPEMRERYFSTNEIYKKILDIESKQGLNGNILLFHLGSDKRRQDKFYPRLYSLLIDLSKAGYDFIDLYHATDLIDKNTQTGK